MRPGHYSETEAGQVQRDADIHKRLRQGLPLAPLLVRDSNSGSAAAPHGLLSNPFDVQARTPLKAIERPGDQPVEGRPDRLQLSSDAWYEFATPWLKASRNQPLSSSHFQHGTARALPSLTSSSQEAAPYTARDEPERSAWGAVARPYLSNDKTRLKLPCGYVISRREYERSLANLFRGAGKHMSTHGSPDLGTRHPCLDPVTTHFRTRDTT